MIYIGKIGDECKHGLNIMCGGRTEILVMLATYRHRVVFGLGWSKILKKLYTLGEYWTLEDDIRTGEEVE